MAQRISRSRRLYVAHASSLLAPPDGSRDLALGFPFGDRLALVVLPLAAPQPDLHLGVVAREIHPQRDQRVALLLDLSDQARDLFPVQEQLARARRRVVHAVALAVGRAVDGLQP